MGATLWFGIVSIVFFIVIVAIKSGKSLFS